MRQLSSQKRERWFLISLWIIVFALTWGRALPQLGGPGLTWDEAFYFPTFEAASSWFGLVFSNASLAFSSDGILAGWGPIHELPPVVKWLGAACVMIPANGWWKLGLVRLFPAIASATSAVLLFLISRRMMPAGAAMFAPVVYACMPAVQGHAMLAATETVFITVTLVTAWAALQDLRSLRWKLILALTCGVALATKVNGVILCAVILMWLALGPLLARRRNPIVYTYRHSAIAGSLILLIAPLAALAIWPWMWHDTIPRLQEYWGFIQNHARQGVWFEGKAWNFTGTPAPMRYPFVMAHVMSPWVITGIFWTASVLVGWRLLSRLRVNPAMLLVVLLIVAPFAAASLPNSPRYDGIRLFLPVFAPAAILIVRGLFLGTMIIRIKMKRRRFHLGLNGITVTAGFSMLVFASVFWSIDYTSAGSTGSKARNFDYENTYWGNALDKECVDDLNAVLKPGARVKTLAMQEEALRIYQRWGVLRPDIIIDPDPPYDVHLLQNRKGFWRNAEWWLSGNRKPLATWGVGPTGEPLIMLFDGRPPGT